MPSINVSLKKFTKSFDDVLLREEKTFLNTLESKRSELSEGFSKRYRGENDEGKSFNIHSI